MSRSPPALYHDDNESSPHLAPDAHQMSPYGGSEREMNSPSSSPRRSPSQSRSSRSPRRSSRSPRRSSHSPQRHSEKDSNNPGNTLFVSGLSARAKELDLEKLFEKHGTVLSVVFPRDPRSGEGRCFGFVKMSSEEEANKCIQSLDGIEFDGGNILVQMAARDREREKTPGRYLGRMPRRDNRRPSRRFSGDGGYGDRRTSSHYGGSRGYNSDYRYNPYSRDRGSWGDRDWDDKDWSHRDEHSSRYDRRDRSSSAHFDRRDRPPPTQYRDGGGYRDRPHSRSPERREYRS